MQNLLLFCAASVCLLSAQGIGINLQGEVENAPPRFVIDVLHADSHIPAGRAFGGHDGRFTIGPLEPGRYEVRVNTDHGDTLRTEYVDVHQTMTPLSIRLRLSDPGARPVSGLVSVKELSKERRSAIKLMKDALVRRRRSDAAGALERYEQAAQMDPSFALAHHELAVHYMGSQRPSDARREFLIAIELDPKLQTAYTNLSIADLTLGDPIAAEQAAERALEMNGDDPKARYVHDLSRWLQRKGCRPKSYENYSGR